MGQPEHLGPSINLDHDKGLLSGMIGVERYVILRMQVLGAEYEYWISFFPERFGRILDLINLCLDGIGTGQRAVLECGDISLNVHNDDTYVLLPYRGVCSR